MTKEQFKLKISRTMTKEQFKKLEIGSYVYLKEHNEPAKVTKIFSVSVQVKTNKNNLYVCNYKQIEML